MSSARQRAALSALDAVRAKASRLDPARNTEENAADIIDIWSAIETALRSLLGGSSLAGQPLIHEARQRQLIGFEQANQLAAFLVVRDRVHRTDYTPNSSDVVTARDAYRALQDGLLTAPATDAAPLAATGTADTVPEAHTPTVIRPARRVPLILVVAVLLLVVGLASAWYFVWGPGSDAAYERGVELFQGGRTEAARDEFERAARQNEDDPRPHIFLGRIARDERDFARSRQELQTAITIDPRNALAQREMGSLLFMSGNYPLARNFYVRAIELDTSDRVAMGYLGCTLFRLGRVQEAMNWFQRAGQGPWSRCAPMLPPAAPQQPPR